MKTARSQVKVFVVGERQPSFEKPEYLLDLRQAPVLGRVSAMHNDSLIVYRLANFNRSSFKVSSRSTLILGCSGSIIRVLEDELPAGNYELVIVAEDRRGQRAFARALVRVPPGALSATAVLTLIIFLLLILIFLIIASFILRRIYRVYVLDPR